MQPTQKTAADVMASKLIKLSPDMELFDAMEVFLRHRISGAPVVDGEGRLVGVLSEKDCMRILVDGMYSSHPGATVGDLMSREVTTIAHDADVLQAAEIFLSTPIRRLPVIRGGVLVGQLSRRDVLRAIHEQMKAESVTRSSGTLEQQTRQGRMVREAYDLLRDMVGPALNRRFAA